MTPQWESIIIVLMSCLGAFVIGFVIGYATRDELDHQRKEEEQAEIFNQMRIKQGDYDAKNGTGGRE